MLGKLVNEGGGDTMVIPTMSKKSPWIIIESIKLWFLVMIVRKSCVIRLLLTDTKTMLTTLLCVRSVDLFSRHQHHELSKHPLYKGRCW